MSKIFLWFFIAKKVGIKKLKKEKKKRKVRETDWQNILKCGQRVIMASYVAISKQGWYLQSTHTLK